MLQQDRSNFFINLKDSNIINVSCIYLKNSWFLYVISMFASILSVFINRLLADNLNKLNWEENITQFGSDLIVRIPAFIYSLSVWKFYDNQKHNILLIIFLSILNSVDAIIGFIHYKKDYMIHSVNNRDFDTDLLNTLDRLLYLYRIIMGTLTFFIFSWYFCDFNLFQNLTFYHYVTFFLYILSTIILGITYGVGLIYNAMFIGILITYFVTIMYNIRKGFIYEHRHDFFFFLQISLVGVLISLPEFLFILVQTFSSTYLQTLAVIFWEVMISVFTIIWKTLISYSIYPNDRFIVLFPFHFANLFFAELIFLNFKPFSTAFFVIFLVQFFYQILHDSSCLQILYMKIIKEDKLNSEDKLEIIRDTTEDFELFLFSERLILFILLIIVILEYILDANNFLTKNQLIGKNDKLSYLYQYIFLFCMDFVNSFITKYIRYKLYNYYYDDVLNHMNPNKNYDDILDPKLKLVHWTGHYSFIIPILFYVIIRGIIFSPLFESNFQ